MKYRKKPVVIEAIQYDGVNLEEVKKFCGNLVEFQTYMFSDFLTPRTQVVIHALEDDHKVSVGDYIIKGVQGEFYPCKPEIFAKTYEAVEEYPTCNESARRDMELRKITHREF